MNFKESLDVYRREEECFKKCENGCIADCEIEKCKYFSTEEELKEAQKCAVRALQYCVNKGIEPVKAQKYAVRALQYCVNKGIEPVTRTEAVKAAKTLKEYCNQHDEDCENCVFVEGAFCNVKKMPFKYEEKGMKNREKYEKELKKIESIEGDLLESLAVDNTGYPYICKDMSCDNCAFEDDVDCIKSAEKWLDSEV